MAKERVIPQAELERMLKRLSEALEIGNREIVRQRLAELIADEHEEAPASLQVTNVSLARRDR